MSDQKPSFPGWVLVIILVVLVLVNLPAIQRLFENPNPVREYQRWGPNPRMFAHPHMVILYLVFPIYCFYIAFRPGGSVLEDGYRLLGLVMGIVSISWLLLALLFG